jgi:hypothetical protein
MEILKRIGSKSEFRTLTGSFLEFSQKNSTTRVSPNPVQAQPRHN